MLVNENGLPEYQALLTTETRAIHSLRHYPEKSRKKIMDQLSQAQIVSEQIHLTTEDILLRLKNFKQKHTEMRAKLLHLQNNEGIPSQEVVGLAKELRKLHAQYSLTRQFPGLIHLLGRDRTTRKKHFWETVIKGITARIRADSNHKSMKIREFNNTLSDVARNIHWAISGERYIPLSNIEPANSLVTDEKNFESSLRNMQQLNQVETVARYLTGRVPLHLYSLDRAGQADRLNDFAFSSKTLIDKLQNAIDTLAYRRESIVQDFDARATQYTEQEIIDTVKSTLDAYTKFETQLNDQMRPDTSSLYCREIVTEMKNMLTAIEKVSDLLSPEHYLRDKVSALARTLVEKVHTLDRVNNLYCKSDGVFTHTAQDPAVLDSILSTGKILSHRSALQEGIPITFVTGSGFGSITLLQKGVELKTNYFEKFIKWEDPELTTVLQPYVNSMKAGGVLHEFDQVYFDWNKFYFDGPNRSQWAVVLPSRIIVSHFQFSDYTPEHGIAIFDKKYDSDKKSEENNKKGFPPGEFGAVVDLTQLPFIIVIGDSFKAQFMQMLKGYEKSLPQKQHDESLNDWITRHCVFVADLKEYESIERAKSEMYSRFAVPELTAYKVPTGNKGDGGGSQLGWNLYEMVDSN